MKNTNKLDKLGRKAAIYLLEKAKEIIETRRRSYVCLALLVAHLDYDHLLYREPKNKLREFVDVIEAAHDALGDDIDESLKLGDATVTGWLRVNHGIYLSDEEARLYRMAWIDQMIGLIKK